MSGASNEDWETWKENENDCLPIKIVRPFRMIKLEGYGFDEAFDDRPMDESQHETIYMWMQRMGTIWHNRLVDISLKTCKHHEENCCRNMNAVVLTIPNKKLFGREIDGYLFPRRVIDRIRSLCNVSKICLVILNFIMDSEGEWGLHLFHAKSVDRKEFLNSLNLRLLSHEEYSIAQKAWTMNMKRVDKDVREDVLSDKWYHLISMETRRSINKRGFEGYRDKTKVNKRVRLIPIDALSQTTQPKRGDFYIENYYGSGTGMPPIFTTYKDEAIYLAYKYKTGTFAYDFYEGFAKKYLVCSAHQAYEIVFKRNTLCLPFYADDDLRKVGYQSMYEGMMGPFPQKVVLDMEYDRYLNPQLDDVDENGVRGYDVLTIKSLWYVGLVLSMVLSHRGYGDEWIPDITDWLVIQADNEKKISRHAILNVPGKFFSSMIDACLFRDVLKASVEAGIMMQDEVVSSIMVNKTVKVEKNTGKLLTIAQSIAEQCYMEGKWKTCFIDWCVINDTYRLMRTFGSTKIFQDRFLKLADPKLFPFDLVNNPMVHEYIREYDVACHASENWRIFMCSLLHNPLPKNTPGWNLTEEDKYSFIDNYRESVIGYYGGDQEAFMEQWTKYRKGEVTSEESGVIFKETKAEIIHKKTNATVKKGAPGISKVREADHHSYKQSVSGIRKEPVLPGTTQYKNIIKVLHAVSDLRQVVDNTPSWKFQACYRPEDQNSPSWFSVFPKSSYCPIGGLHKASGKTIINLTRRGRVTARCLGGRCSGLSWSATQTLSPKAIQLLWDH